MTKNMGKIDRSIRFAIAAIVGILILTQQISGLVATVLGIIAVIFVVTSTLSFCPLYRLFNLSTNKRRQAA